MHRIEDALTPLQLQAAMPILNSLDGLAAEACKRSDIMMLMRRAKPQPFIRQDIASDIALFTGPAGNQRDLIVAFCGRSQRLMTCWSLFLQFIPADRFDVLILADRSNAHFFNGIKGYADSFYELMSKLNDQIVHQRYRRVFAYGTSTGGFPALRGGIVLRAFRAVSVGGQPVWHIHRLIDRAECPIPAFDILCACSPPSPCQLVCTFAAGSVSDIVAAARLARSVKITPTPVRGFIAHNFVHQMFNMGRLEAFYGRVFDFAGRPA